MTTKKFGSRGSCIVSSASLASRSLPLVLLLVANLLSGLLVTKIAQLFNLFTGKTVFRAGVKWVLECYVRTKWSKQHEMLLEFHCPNVWKFVSSWISSSSVHLPILAVNLLWQCWGQAWTSTLSLRLPPNTYDALTPTAWDHRGWANALQAGAAMEKTCPEPRPEEKLTWLGASSRTSLSHALSFCPAYVFTVRLGVRFDAECFFLGGRCSPRPLIQHW